MPSTEADLIVARARAWVGTPYRHQHRARGLAVDCVGLIVGVGIETGFLAWDDAEFERWAGYSRTPNPTRMGAAIEHFLEPVMRAPLDPPGPGSIAWMGWRRHLPMHLGILAEFNGRRTLIHAFEHRGQVVEHDFAGEWPERVVSWWRYPGAPEEI